MKKINAHKAHQRLWYWLMRNPYMSKDKWPEWNINGGKIPFLYVHDQCFACMIVQEDCPKCPLEWPNGKTCDGGNTSLYRLWLNAPDSLVRKEYAQQIAELPWHGKKMFTFNRDRRIAKGERKI